MEPLPEIFGNSENILWWQMIIRAVLVFFYLLLLVRLGARRMFGKSTTFDIVLAILVGSVLSRAVTGEAELIPAGVSTLTLVLLHFILAKLAFRSHALGNLIKGKHEVLVKNGTMLDDVLKRHAISEHDLQAAIRSCGAKDLSEVEEAWFERDGKISVVPVRAARDQA